MPDIKSLDQISLILGFIVPGLIIVYLRTQFLTGRLGSHTEALLSYFTLSVVYWAVIVAGYGVVTGLLRHSVAIPPTLWLAAMLCGAVLFGVAVGLNARYGLTRGLLKRCGLRLPHVMDTAWDWRFSRFNPTLMTITLQDGSEISGWCGERSFVGSHPDNRDLFIEQVYDVDQDGNWILKTAGKGVYIGGAAIKFIEIIPVEAARNDGTQET